MEVVDLILCDYAAVQPGGKYTLVGGGFTEIGARQFPCTHPLLYTFMRLKVGETDIGRNNISIRIQNEANEIKKREILFEVPAKHVGTRMIPLPMQFMNLTFSGPDIFRVTVEVNGELKGWCPLRIHEINANNQKNSSS